jgi:hypothetical protein
LSVACVELRGRGALTVRQKRARQGRYPRTGQALMLRARRAVCFRASALLRRRLNCIRIDRSNPKPNRRQLPLPIDNESQGQGCRQTLTAPPLRQKKRTRQDRAIKKARVLGDGKKPAQKKTAAKRPKPKRDCPRRWRSCHRLRRSSPRRPRGCRRRAV